MKRTEKDGEDHGLRGRQAFFSNEGKDPANSGKLKSRRLKGRRSIQARQLGVYVKKTLTDANDFTAHSSNGQLGHCRANLLRRT